MGSLYSDTQDGSGDGIYYQLFDSSGNKVGSESRANTETSNNQRNPKIDAFTDGEFIIVWDSAGQDSDSSTGIYSQRFDSNGNKIGNESQINTYIPNSQSDPDVTTFDNGWYAICWSSNQQDGDSTGVYAKLYNADNDIVVDEFRVNDYTTDLQASCAIDSASDTTFMITWQSRGQDLSGLGIYSKAFEIM